MRRVFNHSPKKVNAISPQTEKKKEKAAVENPRTVKSRRLCDAEVDRLIELLEERLCLWDVFCKDYHVSPSLDPVSSRDCLTLLFQHFKQSKSG